MEIRELSKRHTILMYDDAFEGIYVNVHIIISDTFNFVIDTGMGENHAQDILDYLKSRNESKKLVIINTHHHWDHIWGNGYLDAAMIVSHKKTYDAILKNSEGDVIKYGHLSKGAVKVDYPNVIFEGTLQFSEDGLLLGFAPGHTDNDIFIYDRREKVLNLGDNIGDTPEDLLPDLTTSVETYRDSLKQYLTYEFDTVISGHNQIQNRMFIHKVLEATYK